MSAPVDAASRLIRMIRREGPVFTLSKALWTAADIEWERRHRVTTRTTMTLDELDLDNEGARRVRQDYSGGRKVCYSTPRIGHLRHALTAIPDDAPRHLVDFGCGLGRVMTAAHLWGFDSAAGIELSPLLCAGARRNLSTMRPKGPGWESLEVVCGDAVDYPIRPEQNVFYFYNPFGPKILSQVLDRIDASVAASPRPAWVLYLNQVHREVLTERPTLEFVRDLTSQHYNSALYQVVTPRRPRGHALRLVRSGSGGIVASFDGAPHRR